MNENKLTKKELDFFGEVSAVLMNKKAVTASDLARMGFGHTIALSALQMVSGISTVINNGYVLEPHLINSVFTDSKNLCDSLHRSIRQAL